MDNECAVLWFVAPEMSTAVWHGLKAMFPMTSSLQLGNVGLLAVQDPQFRKVVTASYELFLKTSKMHRFWYIKILVRAS